MNNKFRQAFEDGVIDEFDLMTGLIYGEARRVETSSVDERKEWLAIGNTVMNRAKYRQRTIDEVILQPWQFSCFNKTDPNRDIIWKFITSPDRAENTMYNKIMNIAKAVIKGTTVDFSGGADHYVAVWFYDSSNDSHWCRQYTITAMYGGHVFMSSFK